MSGVFKQALLPLLCHWNQIRCAWNARQTGRRLPTDPPPGERILIVAPHMDDEVIGCGGLIAQSARAGRRVACVYLTDGSCGRTGDEGRELVRIRVAETRAAAALLGLGQLYFLHEPDGALASTPTLIKRLEAVLRRECPDVVLLPYPCDPHPDHRAAYSVAVEALPEEPAPEIWVYQIQVPIPVGEAETALDISAEWDHKQRALTLYASQTAVPFAVIRHLQECQRFLAQRPARAVELYGRLTLAAARARAALLRPCGLQVKTFFEIGRHAIRRRSWI